jgi:hypothetical protein
VEEQKKNKTDQKKPEPEILKKEDLDRIRQNVDQKMLRQMEHYNKCKEKREYMKPAVDK